MDVIACTELTKRFGSTTAVDRLHLRVGAGQVYGFLGPNGAGKTTTIRMLLGLISPTAGQIELLGARLPDPRATARTGSMIEEPTFYPWLTGRQNLQVLGATSGSGSVGQIDGREIARVVGLTGLTDAAAKKVRTYSQGMRQRLGIAAAMLGRPPLLIVDEPTNGLDPSGIRDIRELLRDLAADGATVFMSSHLLAEVEQVCDRVAVIVRGRLVDEGPPATLGAIRRRVRVRVEPADTSAAVRLLARWSATRSIDSAAPEFIVQHDSGRDVNAALIAGGVIAESVATEQPALEDRFLELTKPATSAQRENDHDVAAAG
ncbi:MAG TPA: ABC transporter ATP-binding protein [Streptosporangiaceae bacterium]